MTMRIFIIISPMMSFSLIFKKKFADETAVADNTPLQVFDEGELPEL